MGSETSPVCGGRTSGKISGSPPVWRRPRKRRAVLLGNEGRDVGRELVARVLVAVVVPAKDGREPAGPQHLGDKHRLAVADRGRPPGCGRRFALALLDRLVEWVDAGVVPRLVAIDERAGAPGL